MLRWFRRKQVTVSPIVSVVITADEFCSRLEAIAPTVESLMADGLSSQSADEYRAGYVCSRLSRGEDADPLLDLCANFDISTVEIATISFCRPEQFDGDHWLIGYDEADPIVYPKSGGIVSVRDHADLEFEIGMLARTGVGLLCALLIVAEFNERNRDLQDAERESVGRPVLEQCLSIAGRESESLYRNLLYVYS